jgi:type IV secretion system protein VirD4
MEDVARWVLVGDLEEPVKILSERSASAWAAGILRGFDQSDPRLRDSILVTAADTIRVYDSELARRQTDGPRIPIREFVASNGTIYIVAPSDVQEQFASLVVGLLDDVRRTTYAFHKPGRPATLLVLDEADKIAAWPKLPSVLGEGGAQGLQVCMCVQDLSQARTRWGSATDGFPTLFQQKACSAASPTRPRWRTSPASSAKSLSPAPHTRPRVRFGHPTGSPPHPRGWRSTSTACARTTCASSAIRTSEVNDEQ